MNLRDLGLKEYYRSDSSNLVKDFYVPCLSQAVRYDRAVGYFSSGALEVAGQGLPSLIRREGRMRLIASPHLNEEDVEAIRKGYIDREAIMTRRLVAAIDLHPSAILRDRLSFLAWMVANGTLDIKVAMISKGAAGIYHEKLGMFIDSEGHIVTFCGSPNESAAGFTSNFECIDVYRSWIESENLRARTKLEHFEDLWQNRTNGLDVLPFPEAARQQLIQYRPAVIPNKDPAEEPVAALPVKLRDYQERAISSWLASEGRGIFQLATGTGKTVTALALLHHLAHRTSLRIAIVIVPYQHLVDQWIEEAKAFSFRSIACYQSSSTWTEQARIAIEAAPGSERLQLLVVTNATFARTTFQGLMAQLPTDSMVIADEVHNLGASELSRSLPEQVSLRLGLSATPQRFRDEAGTKNIFHYFGQPLQPILGVKEAIDLRPLTPYYYHPIEVSLTDAELDRYLEITDQIIRALRHDESEGAEIGGTAEMLLIRRARILAGAENKLIALRSEMQRVAGSLTRALIYAGEASVVDADGAGARQIDRIVRILGIDLGMSVAPFVAETTLHERRGLIRSLENGELQALVAMKCLDEGVDIPCVQSAYLLSSSRNPRQFVQRRGRVLRRYPGKYAANIHDMIVTVPEEYDRGTSGWRHSRELIRRELERARTFCDDAINSDGAWNTLFPLRKSYDLIEL